MRIFKLSESKIHKWSGGTTRELLIYPDGSSFSDRDFELRISIATVEEEETTFTPLENIQRTLLVLEGTQEFQHEGAHAASLKKFDQDSFSGDWTTYCRGTSINFNVMTKTKTRAEVVVKCFDENDMFHKEKPNGACVIFFWKGSAKVGDQQIDSKEAIVLDRPLEISFQQSSEIVIVNYP